MRKIPLILAFIGLGLVAIVGTSGCGKTLTLASNKVNFVEGVEATKSIPISAGKAEQVDAKDTAEGLTASVNGSAIEVKATTKVKVGSYQFTVSGNKGKDKATFTVNVTKAVASGDVQSIKPGDAHPVSLVGDGQPGSKPGDGQAPKPGDGQPTKPGDGQPTKPGEGSKVEENLVLEPTTVILPPPPSNMFVKVVKGALKLEEANPQSTLRRVIVETKVPFLSFEADLAHKGFLVVVSQASMQGSYKALVKGESGPDVELTVLVPPAPSTRETDLKMVQDKVEFTAGKKETKVVEVKTGWASNAQVMPPFDPVTKKPRPGPVTGLTASAEKTPIRVVPTNVGFRYKADEILTIAEGVKVKVVSVVDDKGAIKEIAVEGTPTYTPTQKRTVELPGKGGSGIGAMFDVTNSVKIEVTNEVKAGKYEVYINGPGGKACSLWVIVGEAKSGAAPRLAPPEGNAVIAAASAAARRE